MPPDPTLAPLDAPPLPLEAAPPVPVSPFIADDPQPSGASTRSSTLEYADVEPTRRFVASAPVLSRKRALGEAERQSEAEPSNALDQFA
jgi:hypothetical protein